MMACSLNSQDDSARTRYPSLPEKQHDIPSASSIIIRLRMATNERELPFSACFFEQTTSASNRA